MSFGVGFDDEDICPADIYFPVCCCDSPDGQANDMCKRCQGVIPWTQVKPFSTDDMPVGQDMCQAG